MRKESDGAKMTAVARAALAPKVAVIGERATPNSGVDALAKRLTPLGYEMALVNKGEEPVPRACA